MTRPLCWIVHRDPASPFAGGAERSISEICLGLTRRGWQVQIISGGFPGCSREEELAGTKIFRGSSPLWMHFQLPVLLKRCIPPEVVIEDLGHVVPFASRLFTQSPRVIFFRHLHHRTLPGQVRPLAGWALGTIERAYPLIYRHGPIVAPSVSALSDLRALGFAPSRLHLIGYGVDASSFRPGKLSETPSVIHFAGLREYKRPQHALYALKLLLAQGMKVDLYIVGHGPSFDSLVDLSRRLGVADRVTFTGRLGDADLQSLIARSWVHVQCSVAEGWGLTVREAAAAGVPTAAYSVPGLTDSVTPGVSGILVKDGDVGALARAIALEIETRADWTERCRESVRNHSWQRVANDWDRLLSELAARPGPA